VTAPVVAGCEPFSATGGDDGVLVLHGFTGSPYSMRPLADVLANRGFNVELPRLPGHGTAVEDLIPMRWEDWTSAAAESLDVLAARSRRVGVVGLSMGGGLAVWLAEHRPELVGVVVVNPLVTPVAEDLRDGGRQLLDAGIQTIDGVVNDIAKPGGDERGYAQLPLAAAMSLTDGLEGVAAAFALVTCPVLILTSREDHTVVTENSTRLADGVSGPVEHLWLERSFHVATLDFDADVIEAETARFLEAAFAAA
jgi:carboxylesterase